MNYGTMEFRNNRSRSEHNFNQIEVLIRKCQSFLFGRKPLEFHSGPGRIMIYAGLPRAYCLMVCLLGLSVVLMFAPVVQIADGRICGAKDKSQCHVFLIQPMLHNSADQGISKKFTSIVE